MLTSSNYSRPLCWRRRRLLPLPGRMKAATTWSAPSSSLTLDLEHQQSGAMLTRCVATYQPALSPSSSPTSRGRRAAARARPGGLRRGPRRAPPADPRGVRREGGVEVDTQGDASSSPSRRPGRVAASRGDHGRAAPGPIRCALAFIRERHWSPTRGTSVPTSTGPLGSPLPVTVGKCSSRPRRHRSSTSSSVISASTASRTWRQPSASINSATASSPRSDPLPDEPADPATPFLGRERELAEVVDLLHAEEVAPAHLTGPGGTGKTRLALQAAAESSERYPDGVWWVPLAAAPRSGARRSSRRRRCSARGGAVRAHRRQAPAPALRQLRAVVEAGPTSRSSVAAARSSRCSSRAASRCASAASSEYPVPPLGRARSGRALLRPSRPRSPELRAERSRRRRSAAGWTTFRSRSSSPRRASRRSRRSRSSSASSERSRS